MQRSPGQYYPACAEHPSAYRFCSGGVRHHRGVAGAEQHAGPGALADRGLDHARRALAETAPTQLGPATRSVLRHVLGDGTEPGAWERLQRVNERLSGARPPRRHA
ncbi:DUF6177 family protein [Streptomyces atratus]